jgi:hypothetical protein
MLGALLSIKGPPSLLMQPPGPHQATRYVGQDATAKSEVDERPWIGKRLIDETGLNEPGPAIPALAPRRT